MPDKPEHMVVTTDYEVYKSEDEGFYFWDKYLVEIREAKSKDRIEVLSVNVKFRPGKFTIVELEMNEDLGFDWLCQTDLELVLRTVDGVGVDLKDPEIYILKPVMSEVKYRVLGNGRYWLERAGVEDPQKE